VLGRILIARDFNVAKCTELVKEYVGFRVDMGGAIPPLPRILATGAFFLPFEDKRGRPVLFVRARYLDPTVPINQMQQNFRSFMDAIILHFLRKRSGIAGAANTNPMEQYLCIVDTEGAGWSNVALSVIKMLVRETNFYYPDRLQEVLVLGVNSTVQGIWRMAAPLVHPRTRKKVSLIANQDAPGRLLALIDREVLPAHWGGEAPEFGLPMEAEGSDLASRVGTIAAAAWRHLGGTPAGSGVQIAGLTLSSPSDRVTVLRHKDGDGDRSVYDLRLQRGGGSSSQGAAADSPHPAPVLRTAAECTELLECIKESSPSLRPPGCGELGEVEDLLPADIERSLNCILADGSPQARSAILDFVSNEPWAPPAPRSWGGDGGGSHTLLDCLGRAGRGRICCDARR